MLEGKEMEDSSDTDEESEDEEVALDKVPSHLQCRDRRGKAVTSPSVSCP